MPARDHLEAVKWFRKAADQNNARAHLNIAWAYENGEGVPKDSHEAITWFSKAAEMGDVSAQCVLGCRYEDGNGVPKDHVQAHLWYNLAAANGHKDCGKYRDWLSKKMTPEEIAEAQQLAREWWRKHQETL